MSKKLSIVIPVNNLEGEVNQSLFKSGLESLKNQTNKEFDIHVLIDDSVLENKVKEYFQDLGIEYNLVQHDLNNYSSIINYAATKIVKSEYFMVLEQDDSLLPNHINNFYIYVRDQALLLNLPIEVNEKNEAMGLRNESFWSVSINKSIGNIDVEVAKQNLQNLSLDGGFYKTELFENGTLLKENLPVFMNQEFILRVAYQGEDIYVIPKIGVRHTMGRVGSYYDVCSKEMDNDAKKNAYQKVIREHITNKDL